MCVHACVRMYYYISDHRNSEKAVQNIVIMRLWTQNKNKCFLERRIITVATFLRFKTEKYITITTSSTLHIHLDTNMIKKTRIHLKPLDTTRFEAREY